MDELDRRMQRVLDAARTGMSPSAVDTERTRRVLLAATAGLAVGVGAGTAGAATAAAASSSAAGAGAAASAGAASAAKGAGVLATISSLSLGTKVVTAVAISASIGGAGVWITQAQVPVQRPAIAVTPPAIATPAIAPAPASMVAPVIEPMPAEAAAVQERRTTPVAPRAALPLVEKPNTPDPLALELGLIERARQGLKNGQPHQALAALMEHRARFEHGVMAQERAALRALALCSLGDPQGKAEAERFLERNPGSPLASHLRTGCK